MLVISELVRKWISRLLRSAVKSPLNTLLALIRHIRRFLLRHSPNHSRHGSVFSQRRTKTDSSLACSYLPTFSSSQDAFIHTISTELVASTSRASRIEHTGSLTEDVSQEQQHVQTSFVKPDTANSASVASHHSGSVDSALPNFEVDSWIRHVHLDGSVYFYHPESRILTKTWVRDPEALSSLTSYIESAIEERLESHYLQKLSEIDWMSWEMVIDDERWYYVDHKAMVTMNADEQPTLWSAIERTERQRSYWGHLIEFPMHRAPPYDAELAFLSAIAHNYSQCALYDESPYVYPKSKCEALMKAYQFIKQSASSEPCTTWLISKALFDTFHHRIQLHYGSARAITTVQEEIPRKFRLGHHLFVDVPLFFLFFGAHQMYVNRLELVSPRTIRKLGDLVYQEEVRNLRQSFLSEWSDTNLLATVVLSANMAFLAIPDINALQRTASLSSGIFALTSIMIGLHHIWRHRVNVKGTWDEAYSFIWQTKGFHDPILMLGVILALPLIVLLWALVLFWGAAVAYAIQSSTVSAEGWLAAFAGLTLLLILGVIYTYSRLQRRSANVAHRNAFTSLWRRISRRAGGNDTELDITS